MSEHKRRFSLKKRSHTATQTPSSSDADLSQQPQINPEQFRGWLLKWTNYIKGYQKRWFVLSNGLLSYYRTQEEMAHTCRGTINLAGAFIDPIDTTNFVITNGPTQVYHLRALNEVERQRWVTALELAKSKAIKNLESDDSDVDPGPEEKGVDNPLISLNEKLQELKTAHDLVIKNSHSLLKHLGDAEANSKLKEKITLFKLTTSGMVKTAEEFMVEAKNTDRRWSRSLQHEHSLRLELQDNMEALASQLHGMESEARKATLFQQPSPSREVADGLPADASEGEKELERGVRREVEVGGPGIMETVSEESDDDDDKFFDAPEESPEDLTLAQTLDQDISFQDTPFQRGHRRDISSTSVNEAQAILASTEPEQLPVGPERTMSAPVGPTPSFFENFAPTLEKRRITIPPKPNHRVNLWSIMKNCIGKDLSKIPMPVNFFEPTSFLQRMVEQFLYSDILDKAASCDSALEQLAHVAIFNASSYASTIYRVGKPFNPLLGETYECDRRYEMGWRALVEQVSHHPPMYAMHVEHKDWTVWEEYTLTSKFRGKYLVCYPIGTTHLVFHRTGYHYTYNRAVSTIHNIIVGRLWVDQSGELNVANHTMGEEVTLKFYPWSYFSRERQRKVRGVVKDAEGAPCYQLRGYWDEYVEYARIISGKGRDIVTGPATVVWKAVPQQPGQELMYGLSEFSCTMNEIEEGIAPTDCRLRPDQRIMENGDFDGANKEKVRVEEKQRAKRKRREIAAVKAAEAAAAGNHDEAAELEKEATYCPVWFEKDYDPLTNTMMHVYRGGYWEGKMKGDWGRELPDIY